MRKTISIHQPDFMPWLGFFNKMMMVDEFVILDHVINNPRDGFWGRRVKVMNNGSDIWMTIPLVKPKESVFLPINRMRIKSEDSRFVRRNLELVRQNYLKTPFFAEVFPIVESYFYDRSDLLCVRNMNFIEKIRKFLCIKTPIVYSSSLQCTHKATELLIEICEKVNGSSYVCGGGAGGYQEDEKFINAGVELIYQNYEHPNYDQRNASEFVKGLSIIDVLMNVGFECTKKLLSVKK